MNFCLFRVSLWFNLVFDRAFIVIVRFDRRSLLFFAAAVCLSASGCAVPSMVADVIPGGVGRLSLDGSMSRDEVGDVNFSIAHALETEGQLEKAAALYQQILKTDPDRTRALHRLAITHDKLGDRERSQELFRKALEESGEDPDLLADYGYSLYLAEEFEKSEHILRRAVEAAPEHSRARLNLGLVLARQGRIAEAEQAFARSGLAEDESRMNIAFARSLNGDLSAAREIYARLQLKHPADVKIAERVARLDHLLAVTSDENGNTGVAASDEVQGERIIRVSHGGG